ncbi:MAG: hypothetical protein EZS28_028887, partial [Streblomastix strix]
MQQQDKPYTTHQDDIIVSGIGNQTTFTNCTFSKINYDGDGAAFKANISYGGKLSINDTEFIECKGNNSFGGTIDLYIINEGYVTILNSLFYQCQSGYGGGISLYINNGGQITISNSTFDQCKSNYEGGGICSFVQERTSILELIDVLFENCSTIGYQGEGGGILVRLQYRAQLIMSENCRFKNCYCNYNDHYHNNGGGCSVYSYGSCIILLTGQTEFDYCSSQYGGGLSVDLLGGGEASISNSFFYQCEAYNGGGIFVSILEGGYIIINESCYFFNCTSFDGGGIYLEGIYYYNNIQITGQIQFEECQSSKGSGGGIYSYIFDGTLNIEDTTFDNCTSSQPGDGGALALIQRDFVIISITNSSFINCKTISNPLEQSFGWGGAINIQFNITASNLNESNFLMRDLKFIECSAVNSIGNNIHIMSVNTLSTGEAIKNKNLLTVKDLSNPPNLISDLYTSVSYAYDYMGINQSFSSYQSTDLNLHNPLFEQSFTSNVPNPTYIDSINGKDIKFCGQQSSMCQTIKYAINRNPTSLSGNPPPDTNYSIIMTSNTNLDTNIQINSTTLNTGYIIIKSDGYSPEAGNDIYIKRLISTSSFNSSLFTISETGDLSLLGLHFDNLNPSSTNALMSITSSDNTQQAK